MNHLNKILQLRYKLIQSRMCCKGIEVHPKTYQKIVAEIPEYKIINKTKSKFVGRIFGIDIYENPGMSENEVRIIK